MRAKILGISGSQRDGNTNILVKECLKGAEEVKDVETEFIHLADYEIKGGCAACYACFKKPSLERLCYYYDDELNDVLRRMLDVDGYIFGSPVYWGSLTPLFRMFSDRTHPLYTNNRAIRNRPAGSVTCALGRVAGQEHVIAALNRFIMFHDMIPIGNAVIWPAEGMSSIWGVAGRQGWPKAVGSTAEGNRMAVKQDKAAMACARILGVRVAEMSKVIKAGFEMVNPENGETVFPRGAVTAEQLKEAGDIHFAYKE
jgi:multimeric flavodoxin WrbA